MTDFILFPPFGGNSARQMAAKKFFFDSHFIDTGSAPANS